MRTTLEEPTSDRGGHDSAGEEPVLTRDNPRRRREPHDEREDDDRRGDGTSRSDFATTSAG
jgi:hypothetical protein